jgi:hypothetical protein
VVLTTQFIRARVFSQSVQTLNFKLISDEK